MANYTFDIYGRYNGTSATPSARSTTTAPPEASPDYNWNGVSWVFVPNIQTTPIADLGLSAAPQSRTLSKVGYMSRFTDVELAAIYTAAKSVVQIEVWLEKFKAAEFVDLDDPLVLEGLQILEAIGLIGSGRADEIVA